MNREKSIALLNLAVADELRTIHQYMYFHFHLDDLGFKPLAALFKKTAIEEMRHLETLADRILFLEGDVEMVAGGPVKKILEPERMLEEAMQGEQQSADAYNRFAQECAQLADSASKRLFEELVAQEEGHFDQFDKQADNIKRFGASYLALQSFDRLGGEPEGAPQG